MKPNPPIEIEATALEVLPKTSAEKNPPPSFPMRLHRRDVVTSLMGVAGATLLGSLLEGNAEAAGGASTTVYYADTQADLRALTGSGTTLAILKGYGTIGDGGGGIFYWNTISTLDDGGIVINATAGSTTAGWRRIYSGPIDVRWFGAIPNGAPADPGIQAAINACAALGGGKIIFPKNPPDGNGHGGFYAIHNSLNIIDNGVNNMWNITLSGDSGGSWDSNQVQLIWFGLAVAPIINLYSEECLIENLCFIGGSGDPTIGQSSPALCAIDITQGTSSSPPPAPQAQPSTFNTIRRVNINGTMVYGIKIGDVGNGSTYPGNADHYNFEDVVINLGTNFGSTTYSLACYYCPNPYGQSRSHRWVGGRVEGANRGFWFVTCAGSFNNVTFGWYYPLNFGIWLDSVTDCLSFTDCHANYMQRFIFLSGNGAFAYPITVRGGTFDISTLPNTDVSGFSGTANCWVYVDLCGPMTFENVQWTGTSPGGAFYINSYADNHGAKVIMRNCVLPYATKWGTSGHGAGLTEFEQQGCIGWNTTTSTDFPLPDATGATGTVTISGTATTATVTLPPSVTGYSAGASTDSPPYSSGYTISLTAGMAVGTSSVATGALRASYKSKTSTNFVIALEVAPGTGKTVEVTWAVRANTSFWV